MFKRMDKMGGVDPRYGYVLLYSFYIFQLKTADFYYRIIEFYSVKRQLTYRITDIPYRFSF